MIGRTISPTSSSWMTCVSERERHESHYSKVQENTSHVSVTSFHQLSDPDDSLETLAGLDINTSHQQKCLSAVAAGEETVIVVFCACGKNE